MLCGLAAMHVIKRVALKGEHQHHAAGAHGYGSVVLLTGSEVKLLMVPLTAVACIADSQNMWQFGHVNVHGAGAGTVAQQQESGRQCWQLLRTVMRYVVWCTSLVNWQVVAAPPGLLAGVQGRVWQPNSAPDEKLQQRKSYRFQPPMGATDGGATSTVMAV